MSTCRFDYPQIGYALYLNGYRDSCIAHILVAFVPLWSKT